MLKKRKIEFVITARASLPRIRTVISACKRDKSLSVLVVVAASMISNKYGHVYDRLTNFGFDYDWLINSLYDDERISSQPKTTGNMICELATFFENQNPDAVVTIADRYETIATAIASSYMNIPLIHILGGEVTGNIDEKVRHSITKLSDFHFVSNKDSFNRVIKLGENKQNIFNTGCPSIDVAKESKKIKLSDINLNGVGPKIDLLKPYVVVLQHSDTNRFSQSRKDINILLKAVKKLKCQIIWFWPNPDAGTASLAEGIRSFRELANVKNIHFLKHLDDMKFLKLIGNSRCLVGNSSVGIRECAYLGVPVVNIGFRQENRLRACNVRDVDLNSENIYIEIVKQLKVGKYKSSLLYGGGGSGNIIAKKLSKIKLTFKKQIVY